MACLDTTVLLDLMGRGGAEAAHRAARRVHAALAAGETVFTTRFSVAELYVGVHKARDPQAEEQAVMAVMAAYVLLEFTEAAAKHFGRITAHLHRLGRPAGQMDALIAATTLAAGEWLISRNATHFADIPGLRTEGY